MKTLVILLAMNATPTENTQAINEVTTYDMQTADPYAYRPWIRYEQVLEIRAQVENSEIQIVSADDEENCIGECEANQN